MERDEDGVWIAERPAIPGFVSQGKIREEALANIWEAIVPWSRTSSRAEAASFRAVEPCQRKAAEPGG